MSKVGFIGMGIMGRPMSLNLIRGGHELYVHSRHGAPQELVAAPAWASGYGSDHRRRTTRNSRRPPVAQAFQACQPPRGQP